MEEKKAATKQNLNLMKTKGFDDLFSCSNKSIYNHREVSCIHQPSILKLFPPNPLLFLLEIFLLICWFLPLECPFSLLPYHGSSEFCPFFEIQPKKLLLHNSASQTYYKDRVDSANWSFGQSIFS